MPNTGPGAYTLGTVVHSSPWQCPTELMPKPSLSLYGSAVLILFPRGELPDAGGFDAIKVQPPPTPNPHPW